MEISHASAETSSASIGVAGKAEKVTVSADAEFMMMIAHGIYSNKPLALVRELLCNARDGHAKAGHPDNKPIIVTLTDNKLVVRDHGTGIPKDKFTSIYLTFGKSTKRQDKKATGGFGVGSKVPWAVTDTFSARNFIDGEMTAYSVVRSDPNADGEPSCTPIMTIPSTEPSGVEVTVPFPEKMKQDIHSCICQFADELGIKVELNGQLIGNNMHFKTEEMREHGFVMLPHHPRTVIQQTPFYVRQGDVFYPVERQEDFADAYDMLARLNPNLGRMPMAFMALPDSIIPTLSRESLQYTDRTCQAIRDLMKIALQQVADHIDSYADQLLAGIPTKLRCSPSFVGTYWSNRFSLDSEVIEFPVVVKAPPAIVSMLINNAVQWTNGRTPYMETEKTSGRLFREKLNQDVYNIFAEKLDQYPYLHKDRVIQSRTELGKDSYYHSNQYVKDTSRDFYEEVMFFRQEMRANENIVDVLFAASNNAYTIAGDSKWSGYFNAISDMKNLDTKKEKLLQGHDYKHARTLTYMSKVVILSASPGTMMTRALEHLPKKRFPQSFLTSQPAPLVQGARYVRLKIGVTPDAVKELETYFSGLGYYVITLMDPTERELREKQAMAEERARLREIPLPTLGQLVLEKMDPYPGRTFAKRKKALKNLIDNPGFKGKPLYMMMGKGKELPYDLRNDEGFTRLVKFVGTDIICVSTKVELVRVMKEGRISVDDALTEAAQRFFTAPGMHEKLFYEGTFFVKRARQNRFLTKYLFNRDPAQLTEKERQILEYLKGLAGLFPKLAGYLHGYMDDNKVYHVGKLAVYSNNQIVDHYRRLFDAYGEDNFCDVHRALDAAYARRASPTRTKARAIMKTILKGKQ